jgi:hypothetical protein
MILTLYFTVVLVILYTEARDCYVNNRKFDLGSELIFSFTWPLSLPLAIYTIWKEKK